MPQVTAIMPEGRQRYFNNDGTPCVGGQLYTYAAGTTNPKTAYQDAAGTTAHPNPIPLDAKGEAVIYWSGAYKIDLKQANGQQVTGYPVDNFKTDPADLWTLAGKLLSTAGASMMGFIQNAAGAVQMSIQDVLRETVSVKRFGAKSDGSVGAADAFIAALAASKHVSVPVGDYLIEKSFVIPADTTLELLTGARLIASAGGVYTAVPYEAKNYLLKLGGATAQLRGGRIVLSGTNNMVGVFCASYQQFVERVRFIGAGSTGAVGLYSDNHSSFFTRNVFDTLAVGFKGITTNFNGDHITHSHFETCDVCIDLDNYTSGQIDSVFIAHNLFNFYNVAAVRANCQNSDFHHVDVTRNYFETSTAGAIGVSLLGNGAFTLVNVDKNIAFGLSASTYFVKSVSNSVIKMDGNSIFNHLYGVKTVGQLLAGRNKFIGAATQYDYPRTVPGGYQTDDVDGKLLRSQAQVLAGAETYDVGAEMSGRDALTILTGAGASAGGKWDAGTAAPALSTFTNRLYRDLRFDFWCRVGDGWQAELVCRLDPATPANYYRLGVRQGGATYLICLGSYGATVATKTFALTGVMPNRDNWGVRGWIVDKYFFIEAYDRTTGAVIGSTLFTDPTYASGNVGMFCNSPVANGEANIKKCYVGPY